jgi:TolB protein
VVRFRLFDVFAGQENRQGLQLVGTQDGLAADGAQGGRPGLCPSHRRGPYFDSRVVFVSETGPKDARQKRLAIMDYDGANLST